MPGWHATIDGRPLALKRYAGVLLEARVPPGRHTVVVRYWPETFTEGLVLAGAAALGLAGTSLRGGGGRPAPAPAPRRPAQRSGVRPRT